MNKLLPSFLLFLIISVIQAYGSQIERIVEQVEQASQLSSDLPIEKRCVNCQPKKLTQKEHKKLLNQCAVDLCGSPQEVLEYNPDVGLSYDLIDIEDIDPEVKEGFDKKVRPAVEEYIEAKFNDRKKRIDAIEGKIQDIQSGNINVYELDEFADSLSREYSSIKRKGEEIRIEPKIVSDPITGEEYSVPAEYMNNMFFYLSKRVIEVDEKYVPVNEKASKAKVYQSVKTDIEEAFVAFFESEFRSLLSKLKREELTPEENKNLLFLGEAIKDVSSAKGNDKHNYLHRIKEDFNYFYKKINNLFSCAKYDGCKKWVRESLESLINQYSIPMEEYKERELNRCLSIYATNLEYENRIKDFKNNYEKYKDRFINHAIPNLSPETKSAFKAFLDNELEISPPLLVKSVDEFLLDDVNTGKNYLLNKTTIPNIKYLLRDDFSPNGRIVDASHACPMFRHFRSNIDGDSVSSRKKEKSLSISMFSCVNHEHGKNIFAHELAHAFDYWFSEIESPHSRISDTSKEEHQKLRECINNKYLQSEIEDPDALFPNDRLRTEEDMADVISYRVFESDDNFLYQCTLLEMDKSANQFIVYGEKGLDSLRKIGMPPFPDPHSHAMVRVLNEAIYKKKPLSPSCKKLIIDHEDRIDFKPCP